MESGDTDNSTGAIRAQLSWPAPTASSTAAVMSSTSDTIPSDVLTIRAEINASDIATIQQDFAVEARSGTIDNIPVGTGRILVISGLNDDGDRIYTSDPVELTISENEVTDAGTLEMISVRSWIQQAYVKAINSDANDEFGYAVSISGDRIAVGAVIEDSNQTIVTNGPDASYDNSKNNSGAVYIYKWTGKQWEQEAYLKALNSRNEYRFGCSVSLYGNRVAIGSFLESSSQTTITNGGSANSDNSKSASGAVYIFKRSGTSWWQEAYIKAGNGDVEDWFGWNVSLTDDTLAVGAQYEDSDQTSITNGTGTSSDNSLENSGAVYIFRRTNTSWAQEAYIKASNPSSQDQFGWQVSLSGDTLAVSAYMEGSSQNYITNGSTAPPGDNDSLTESGAVYIYQRTDTLWEQQAYIKAGNPGQMDWFGKSISLSGDVLVVGSFLESSGQRTITNGTTTPTDDDSYRSGAAYVYRRTDGQWAQEAYIKAVNADENDRLGRYIALDENGDRFIVSAEREDSDQDTITNDETASSDNSASEAGAVYVYKRENEQWMQEAYIKAANSDAGDLFGEFLDIEGNTIVVGTRCEDSGQRGITNGDTASINNSAIESGAAYIYRFLE